MTLDSIRERLAALPFFGDVRERAAGLAPGASLRLKGAVGSTPAFLLADLADAQAAGSGDGPGVVVALLGESESADYLRSDLEQVLGSDDRVLFFPPTGQEPYEEDRLQDSLPLVQRADVLGRLREGFRGVLVTSVEAISELVPPPGTVADQTLVVTVGDEVAPEDLLDRFVGQGFEPVEFVAEPGECATRGGILDVYPFAGGFPVRIEFFGDEVDQIREFDPQTQRSVSRMESARIVPNLDRMGREEAADGEAADGETGDGEPGAFGREHTTPFAFVPEGATVALFDRDRLAEIARTRFEAARERYDARLASPDEASPGALPHPAARFLDADALDAELARRPLLLFGTFAGDADETLTLAARPQPNYNGDVKRLRADLEARDAQGWTTAILCDSKAQLDRLFDLLGGDDETGREPPAALLVESLHEGFEVPAERFAVYTDHEVFNRYHRPTARKRKRAKGGLSLRDVQGLSPGDFVVHVDYGIGRFAGLQTIEVRGQQQEAARLQFAGGDELFVNVAALHKLHKYTGKEGHQPRLTKLGTGAWERLKARTKGRVKDIARDLIKLYAARRKSKGHGFEKDGTWQRELEASFPYIDTPDQSKAVEAIKGDMEAEIPMDRLVCGDVGFGKTEVAVRAAFKAVQDGKQVGVVVPTTILARQHWETFSQRMADFPVRVAQLSRFVPASEQKETVRKLKEGEVDVVIGTQRLLSKDVEFKDLGLLIVDEEQRFGVKSKEKLRSLRPNVDTLTLTATPIPRTLQFSLLGARDLSLIQTPPPNRQPVVTEIHTYSKDLIRDAILYETSRGGQVFFVHNRVRNIEAVAEVVQGLVPQAKVRVGHGQMPASTLEKVITEFIDGRFEVFVCTNIVESGIDVSNANTIVINHAEHFGLSDLHQLRGRVGRSDRKAFCYLLVPSVHTLTREARQRLKAVEEFSDLGSGFHIAMRDLDIRGAGDLLGAEQSGFIEDVGFETYHKILDEAVQELRQDEFADVFEGQPAAPPAPEPTVDVDDDVFIPDSYVSNPVERLNLYRRLADVVTDDDARGFRDELADRFGPVPPEVETLLTLARMKPAAHALRLPRVTWKNERVFLGVPNADEDPHFHKAVFEPMLARLDESGHRYVLKDSARTGKLRVIVQGVPTLAAAADLLEALAPDPEPERREPEAVEA